MGDEHLWREETLKGVTGIYVETRDIGKLIIRSGIEGVLPELTLTMDEGKHDDYSPVVIGGSPVATFDMELHGEGASSTDSFRTATRDGVLMMNLTTCYEDMFGRKLSILVAMTGEYLTEGSDKFQLFKRLFPRLNFIPTNTATFTDAELTEFAQTNAVPYKGKVS